MTTAFLYEKEKLLNRWRAIYPFPIHDLGFAPPKTNPLIQSASFLRGLWRLFRLMRGNGFTAIETFTHHANLIGLPTAWLAGIPKRIGSHRGKIEGLPAMQERLHAMMINSPIASGLIVVAERVKEDALAEGVHAQRIVKIANGVAIQKVDPAELERVRAELKLNEKNQILLSVGRLRYQKGQDILLRALPRVVGEFPNVILLIAGEGILREELQAEATQSGISKQVKFLGVRDDIPVLMGLADIFLFPSRFEGMPNALLEAMGYGLPTIATAVQGVDELIRDGENGLLIPMDDPESVSDAILRLLKDPEECKRLGSAARETIEKAYTIEKMCGQFEKLLTDEGNGHP